MGELVAYGCPACGVAHCHHARPVKHSKNTPSPVNLVMGLAMAAVLLGATPAVKEAVTPDPPPPATARPTIAWSDTAKTEIPGPIQKLYWEAADTCPALSPFLLAGIGRVESNHGKSDAPGVHDGVNFAGCCAGLMQFNLTDTWDAFAGDYNHDGKVSVYDPGDAIPAAAKKLCGNGLEPNDGNRLYKGVEDPCPDVSGTPESHRALRRYNNDCGYARDVIDYGLRYAHEGRGVT